MHKAQFYKEAIEFLNLPKQTIQLCTSYFNWSDKNRVETCLAKYKVIFFSNVIILETKD